MKVNILTLEAGLPNTGSANGLTVSNYQSLPEETLSKLGWLPLVDDDQPDYDPVLQEVVRDGFTIQNDVVHGHWKVVYRETIPLDPEWHNAALESQTVVADAVTNGTITVEVAAKVAALFPAWSVGESVIVGDIRCFDRYIYTCVQAHTTQADWTPDLTPALWAPYRDPNAIAEWVQPTGSTDAYPKGAKVTHNGKTWTSNVDANVWEPGVSQWTQVS